MTSGGTAWTHRITNISAEWPERLFKREPSSVAYVAEFPAIVYCQGTSRHTGAQASHVSPTLTSRDH